MKTIALEKGMDELKTALEQRGYRTVYEDEIASYVDAYLYTDPYVLGQQSFHASLNNSLLSGTTAENASILLVNAKDKTPDEIIAMIENRVYSPLF
jgi:hypothetical protein